MNVTDAIIQRRTKRKYTTDKVSHNDLITLVEYTRYAPMPANLQPLKYVLIEDESLVKKVFSHTKWSGYHPENAPSVNEMPSAFIAMLGDADIKSNGIFEVDAGIAGTIISLVAEELGLSSCWLGAIDREEIAKLLNLKDNMKLLYLIAVGYSEQEARAIDADGDIKYFTDANGVLNVPKRKLDEIIITLD